MIALQLRKLEAYGFKSFADKLEIEFGRGVTAIVGPNGSGKSNITDAIRWVLGEQNVRNIRGARAEDVIFAGSAGRRALGAAEVSLVFDNSDGALPLDFREVAITRRIFRSGDSEYYINKSGCRLKDIHELLSAAGLGRDAMTVISQNKMDEVLNSKPEERRALFEDAAGIAKYKHRKKEALRKLEDTARNLARVGDIVAEVKRQLEPLEESAAKARRHQALQAELAACRIAVLYGQWLKSSQLVESARLQNDALAEAARRLAAEVSLRETDAEKITDALSGLEEQLQAANREAGDLAAQLERGRGLAAVAAERLRQNEAAAARLTDEAAEAARRLAALQARRAEQRAALSKAQREGIAAEAACAELARAEAVLTAAILGAEQAVAEEESQARADIARLAEERNTLAALEREQAAARDAQALQETRRLAAVRTGEAAGRRAKDAQERLAVLTAQMEDLDQQTAQDLAAKHTWQQRLKQTAVARNMAAQRQSALESRRQVLAGMQAEYEGFGRAVKSVLKSRQSWRAKICGAVAELIRAPEPYIAAVETALGGALQNVVTLDDQTARQAIGFLKTQQLGRATFLPLNTVRPAAPRESERRAARAAGALGFAAAVVECKPEYQKIVDFLLGRTILAPDLETATAIARAQSFGVRVVTLEGDVITPGGAMTGGAGGRREAGFLGRAGEIAALERQLQTLARETAKLEQDGGALESRLAELERRQAESAQRRQACQLEEAELKVHLENAAAEQERQRAAAAAARTEGGDARRRRERSAEQIAASRGRLAELEQRGQQRRRTAEQRRTALDTLTKERQGQAAAQTENKIRMETLRQERSHREEICRQLERELAELEEQLAKMQEETTAAAARAAAIEAERRALQAKAEALSRRAAAVEAARRDGQAAKLERLAALQRNEQAARELRRRHADSQNRLHQAELLANQYQYEAAACEAELKEQHALSPAEAASARRPEPADELPRRVRRLEQEIAALGPVNQNAVAEYAALKERYDFLKTQAGDLTAARSYLENIVGDMDRTMTKQFAAAFHEINRAFGAIFVRLFGGGQARLELERDKNVLEAGVELIVQPPGKKLQNLTLLSGGERALTVVALLFAFLDVRPAPFSVVDEIDAPLDEANLDRFSAFLRNYAQNTQFIVVTHRRGTMEAADVMHGVTLEEAGVSRVISVRLADQAG